MFSGDFSQKVPLSDDFLKISRFCQIQTLIQNNKKTINQTLE